jgi:hypothetical protein
VAVLSDLMVVLARFFNRVYMNHSRRKRVKIIEELMLNLFGNCVALCNREFWRDCNIDLCVQPVHYSSGAHIGDHSNPRNKVRRFFYLIDHLRLHSIQKVCETGFYRFPHNTYYHSCDEKSHDGSCKRIAQPYSLSSEKDGKACPAISPRMVSICNEGGAFYLLNQL